MSDPVAEDSYRALAESYAAGALATDTPNPTEIVPNEGLGEDALPGGRIAARPVWDPTEDARQRAIEAAEAAALAEHPRSRRHVNAAAQPDAVARRAAEAQSGRHHHTIVPRTMVLTAMLAGFASPILLIVLKQQGHLKINGTNWTIDDSGRNLVVGSAVGAAACCVMGWLWWTVAAALNARRTARYTVSPLFAPLSLLVATACAAMLPMALKNRSKAEVAGLAVATGLAVLIAHFGVLGAYRKAAGALGAPQMPWTMLIVLPWIAAAADLVLRFFFGLVGTKLIGVVVPTALVLFGLYLVSLYRAMSSFDSACSGRQMSHTDRGALPDFLKRGS